MFLAISPELVDRAVCPWIQPREQRCRAGRRKAPGGIVRIEHRCALCKPFEVGSGFPGVAVQRQVPGRHRVENKDQDVW